MLYELYLFVVLLFTAFWYDKSCVKVTMLSECVMHRVLMWWSCAARTGDGDAGREMGLYD